MNKTALTTEEIYKVAYLHHVMGVEQLVLSVAFSVNAGRISEACTIMQHAAENLPELRKLWIKQPPTGVENLANPRQSLASDTSALVQNPLLDLVPRSK